MVSGLVTSPCDQLRIFSGDASMMRIASKSVMGLESSNGFERNKATLLGGPHRRLPRYRVFPITLARNRRRPADFPSESPATGLSRWDRSKAASINAGKDTRI